MTEIDAQSTIGTKRGVSSKASTHGSHSERGFSMSRGDGEGSYSKNSSVQSSWVDKVVLPRLDEALKVVALPSHGPVRVADLGCSSGPNAIRNMDHLVAKLRARFSDLTPPLPEFQVYRDRFMADSFLVRRFTSSSLRYLFTTYPSPATAAACEEQASLDLRSFLDSRAVELAPGGLLCFAGRAPDPQRQRDEPRDDPGRCVDLAWGELVSEGIITKEQANVINWPVYHRRIEEVLKDVESYSSAFQVRVAEVVMLSSAESVDGDTGNPNNEALSKTVCGFIKGAFGQFFESYLGEEVKDLFFTRCEEHVRKSGRASKWLLSTFIAPPPAYVVILIRKN